MSETARAPNTPTNLRGFGRIFRRGRTCWIAYYRRGHEYRESTHSESDAVARKLLKKRIGEIESRRFVGPTEERVTFDALAAGLTTDYQLRRLRSGRTATARVGNLKEYFGDCRAVDITPARVRAYQTQRQAEGVSPATVNRETATLRRMFRLAMKAGQLTAAPVFPDRLPESAPRQGFFERHEYLAVRSHLVTDYADVLDFAYYSGWRRREILDLTWAEVDLGAGVIRLSPDRSKTRSGRVLPLATPTRKVLQRRLSIRRLNCPLVFHRHGEGMVDWRKAWEKACVAAKLPGKRLHDCRRTAARNLVRAGVPERVAMQLTGHKTRSVFDRYNIVVEADLRSGVDQLAHYVEQQPTDEESLAKKVAG